MKKQVSDEYHTLRNELESVRSCMTSYIGWVIAGSGAAIFGFATGAPRVVEDKLHWVGLGALADATVIAAILVVVMYKFSSHNRYTGYAKLLSQECVDFPEDECVTTWEVCMDLLRRSEHDRTYFNHLIRRVKFFVSISEPTGHPIDYDSSKLAKMLDEHNVDRTTEGPKRLSAFGRLLTVWNWIVWKGIRDLYRTFFGRRRLPRGSWRYPPFVVTIFFLLTLVFVLIGVVLCHSTVIAAPLDGPALIAYFLVAVLAWTWWRVLVKLHYLMSGPQSIEAFCWTFLPLRYNALQAQYGATFKYTIARVDELITEQERKL